ncbi:TetR/AcrR family transcriptional regulator [Actinomarinicola tropica]|uniref:TetR family transcriptional regulator n=1 Tax=Actinomarinicola tropica TaxID=2789776 RepID=A0A5Q2RKW9_9ACTN|nr:TetR/AcrR family transcriptional regulator [Actinomarinicola tropica]QGG95572.1 TetR family transcriptional regulator [Actinomarinicola tropica]
MTERRLTPRGRERRRQIMDFATARFAEKGYDPTSVADIVDGLGVGKGVFYWYFQSKEDLLVEILVEAQDELARVQDRAMGDEADAVRRIELAIRATVDWQSRNRDLATIRRFAAGEDRFADALRRNHERAVAGWVALVKAGIADGRIRPDPPTMLANAIVGVITNFDRVLIKHGSDPQAVADVAVRFCLGGLVAEGAASVGSARAS